MEPNITRKEQPDNHNSEDHTHHGTKLAEREGSSNIVSLQLQEQPSVHMLMYCPDALFSSVLSRSGLLHLI